MTLDAGDRTSHEGDAAGERRKREDLSGSVQGFGTGNYPHRQREKVSGGGGCCCCCHYRCRWLRNRCVIT